MGGSRRPGVYWLWGAVGATMFASMACPAAAWAEDEGEPAEAMDEAPAADGPPVGLEPSPMDLLFPKNRTRSLSIGINTLRFSPRQEALSTIYPDAPWRFGLAIGAFPLHRVHPRVELSALRMDGLAVGQFSAQASEEVTSMWVFPTELGVEYFFDYSWEQIIVPFVGGGADAYPWREQSPEAVTTGVKWGMHGTAGLMLRLNFMETTTHWATGAFLPSDAGVSLRLTYAWVDSFGHEGLDFSGLQFGVGGVVAF